MTVKPLISSLGVFIFNVIIDRLWLIGFIADRIYSYIFAYRAMRMTIQLPYRRKR